MGPVGRGCDWPGSCPGDAPTGGCGCGCPGVVSGGNRISWMGGRCAAAAALGNSNAIAKMPVRVILAASTGALRRLQAGDDVRQDLPHRLLLDAHQDRVLERVPQHLHDLRRGSPPASSASPGSQRHCHPGLASGGCGGIISAPATGSSARAGGGLAGTGRAGSRLACVAVLLGRLRPFRLVALKMNLPRSSSRLTEDWVMVIVWPGLQVGLVAAGRQREYLPPSRLSLVIAARGVLGQLDVVPHRQRDDGLEGLRVDPLIRYGADLHAGDPHVGADRQSVDMLEVASS